MQVLQNGHELIAAQATTDIRISGLFYQRLGQFGQVHDVRVIAGPGIADIEDALGSPQLLGAVAAVVDDQRAVVKSGFDVGGQIPCDGIIV